MSLKFFFFVFTQLKYKIVLNFILNISNVQQKERCGGVKHDF